MLKYPNAQRGWYAVNLMEFATELSPTKMNVSTQGVDPESEPLSAVDVSFGLNFQHFETYGLETDTSAQTAWGLCTGTNQPSS